MRACSVVQSWDTLSAIPWSVARQGPLSIGFSREEYWSGLPFPSPSGLPDPRIEPGSPESPALAGGFCTTAPPGKPLLRRIPACEELMHVGSPGGRSQQ